MPTAEVEQQAEPLQQSPELEPDRLPLQEIGKRLAEAGAGLKAAQVAVGLEDHRARQAEHRRRERHGFDDGANALYGKKGAPMSDREEPDMGDIIVTGDIHVGEGANATEVLKALKGKVIDQTKTPAPPPADEQKPAASPVEQVAAKVEDAKAALPGWLKTGLMLGAAGLGGGGITAIVNHLTAPAQSTVIQQPADPNRYTIGGSATPLNE